MKSKIFLLFLIFIILNLLVYFVTDINKQQRINKALKINLKQLQTDYETLVYHQKINNKAILNSIKHSEKDIINKITKDLNEKQLNQLRNKLYDSLKKQYKSMKLLGVYQTHFILPNNKSFLRLHKPNKYGDDLSEIRYSYQYINKNKIAIEGFEGGKTASAYRYVYPIFNDKGQYVLALDISYSTDYLQNYLTTISKLHTHFLINKEVFSNKVWEREDKKNKFEQSSEHNNYMLTMTPQHTVENCVHNNKTKLKSISKQITLQMNLNKPFSIYVKAPKVINKVFNHKETSNIEIVSFYPIKSTKSTNEAWLVSYTKSDFIEITLQANMIIRTIAFFIMLIIFYLVYKSIEQKQKLQFKTDQLSDFVNSTTDYLWEIDTNATFTYLSDSVEQILGYTPQELIGKTPFDLMNEKERKRLEAIFKEVSSKQGNAKDLEISLLTKNGNTVYVLTNGVPIYKDKIYIGYRGTDKDITTQKKQTKLIHEQSKNASLGEMIGNIAHQWRQPLSVISSGATGMIIQKQFNKLSDEQFENTCNAINDNAQYLSKTIDDFRNFIRNESQFVNFNLTKKIDTFLNLVNPSFKRHNFTLVLNLDDSIEISGYPNELIQCFMNIFNNAKDALKSSKNKQKYIFITTYKQKKHIIIKFKDNAGGIPSEVLPKIFEPYFTTKHQSQGTGLGLSMTYSLITDSMKGTISAENIHFDYKDISYIGAEFTITLPLSIQS